MTIAIINTGCANLASVRYALGRLGYNACITDDAEVILKSQRVIIPGVGTALAAMRNLQEKALIEVIPQIKVPVLGICLGMQLLGNSSEESGGIPLLKIIDGSVKKLQTNQLPLPHMGWNKLSFTRKSVLFKNIPEASSVYFVHTFGFEVLTSTIATTTYGDRLSAAIQKDNFYGVQFHPERSGHIGAQILQNFIEEKI